MKKSRVLSVVSALVLAFILTACGGQEAKDSGDKQVVDIGVNQLATHPALDAVRDGFMEGLKEEGIEANVDVKDAGGQIPVAGEISNKFVSDGKDLIFAIATPAAQSAKQATTDIPVLFSAVTDPVEVGLVDSLERPGGNVTGTSDESPIREQLELFKALDPDIKTIGIVFSTTEPNSQVQIDRVEELGKELGLKVETIGIDNINDVAQAVDSILPKVDAIYTITDNTVASAINIVAQKATDAGKITVGAERAHVEGGILLTDGISYFELGKQSAKMAKEILNGKNPGEIPVEKAADISKTVNAKTLEKLGLDKNLDIFKEAEFIGA